MTSKLEDAANALIEELMMATGLPEKEFTVVLTIDPQEILVDATEMGTQFVLKGITINEAIYSYNMEDF